MLRTINDRVYGEIAVSGVASRLLSNKWLVRLDYIRQLGACSFVYPSATHTRREHSIGVYHVAGIMASHIRQYMPSITDEDIELVRIAGLLHDVGHGPFSHMYESFWKDRGERWCHEEQTMRILADDIMSEIYDVRKWTHTVVQNLAFLRGLITGTVQACTGRDISVVCALLGVVHSDAGVDADRIDYLLRDTLCVFGSTHTVDAMRIIHSIRIVDGYIAFDQKVSLSIQQLFELRTRLHRQVYQHRDVLVVETLIKAHMDTLVLPAESLSEFCDLTDTEILKGAPHHRLHQYPRMYRVPIDLVVPTSSLCPCGYEFLNVGSFCPMCGVPEENSYHPPVNLTGVMATEHARLTLGVTDMHVLISDVTHGSLCDVPFHNGMGQRYTVTDNGGRPARYHLRTVYCYTETPYTTTDLGERTTDALTELWKRV